MFHNGIFHESFLWDSRGGDYRRISTQRVRVAEVVQSWKGLSLKSLDSGGNFKRQNYTLVEQKAILLILISIIDKNINFSSK